MSDIMHMVVAAAQLTQVSKAERIKTAEERQRDQITLRDADDHCPPLLSSPLLSSPLCFSLSLSLHGWR